MLGAREPVRGREGEKGSVCVCACTRERVDIMIEREKEREGGERERETNAKCHIYLPTQMWQADRHLAAYTTQHQNKERGGEGPKRQRGQTESRRRDG
jgi:hypothetical protein